MKHVWLASFRSVAVWLVTLVIAIAVIKLIFAFVTTMTATATSSGRDPVACEAFADDTARLNCYDSSLGRTPSNPARGAVIPKL